MNDSSALPVLTSSVESFDFPRDAEGKLALLGDKIVVRSTAGETKAVSLRPVRELFAGTARAPDLSSGPTPKLMPFFLFLEMIVVRFCEEDGRDQTDQEMERVYSEMRRRPDGRPASRLHSYLRAAARLYMSKNDISEAEYDAVMRRLTKSARTFSMSPISRNYMATLRHTFEQ